MNLFLNFVVVVRLCVLSLLNKTRTDTPKSCGKITKIYHQCTQSQIYSFGYFTSAFDDSTMLTEGNWIDFVHHITPHSVHFYKKILGLLT